MMIQAVLSNPHHPEYGVATIPFPIPHDQYAHCMELLEALEIGDAVKADCQVQKINGFYSVLKRMEMLTVNVEELNYLAKRLDSFDTGEAAQFQAVAHKLELFELKDLINLTLCCQQATVITDFSDLAAVGRNHYMNLHGGSAKTDELKALDGEAVARSLIAGGSGTVTPYGVVYDNGMKLEQVYDGQFFPCYYYEPNAITVAVTAKSEPEDTEHITWLHLPIRERKFLWSVDIIELNKQIAELTSQNQLLATLREGGCVDPDIFISKSNALTEQLRAAKQAKSRILNQDGDDTISCTQELITILKRGPKTLPDFDGELFGQLIDKVIIESNTSLRFRLKNGLELRENIERTVR